MADKPSLFDVSEAELAQLRARAKQEIRGRMRGLRRVLPQSVCEERSQRACNTVLQMPQFVAARCIAGYVAMRKEIDPMPLLTAAHALGKTLALPRMQEDGSLVFHAYVPGEPLEESGYEVLEPLASTSSIDPSSIDVVIVPALAIDPRGYRVGYGQGFYDRALPNLTQAYKIGLAYDFQLVAEAPNTEHDVAVDCVVTDTRVFIAAEA